MAPPDQTTIHLIRNLVSSGGLAAERFADRHDLGSTDLRALIALLDCERSGIAATPGHLSRHLNINSASTTTLVDRLVARDLVHRGPDADDRRRILITVTESAREMGEQFFQSAFDRISLVESRLTDADRTVVRDFLRDATDALSCADFRR